MSLDKILSNHQVDEAHAMMIADWIKNRGGVAIFRSISLSNPNASWSVPALTDGLPTPKPNWQSANEPERIILSSDEIDVVKYTEVQRFHIKIIPGGSMNLVLSDGSSRRVRKAIAKVDGGTYTFDGDDAVIWKPAGILRLTEWMNRA